MALFDKQHFRRRRSLSGNSGHAQSAGELGHRPVFSGSNILPINIRNPLSSDIMLRGISCDDVTSSLFSVATWPLVARARQAGKLPIIGFRGTDAAA